MTTATIPPAHENIGERILLTVGSNAETEPLDVNLARPGDFIFGYTGLGPVPSTSTLKINLPFTTISLRAYATGPDVDGVWVIEDDNLPSTYAHATIVPDGGGSPSIQSGSFNVASVVQSGNTMTITVIQNLVFGDNIAADAAPFLYPKVGTPTDTTADYIIDSFDIVAGSFTFLLGQRNKNGQWSDDNWDGANDLCVFEVI